MSTLAPPLSPSEHDCLCRWAARIGLNRIATTIGTSRSALQRIAGEGRASPAMRARLVTFLTTEPPPNTVPCPDGCGAQVVANPHNVSQGPAPCPSCGYRRKLARVQRERELRRKVRSGEMARVWQERVPAILAILARATGPLSALEISTSLGVHVKAISLPLAQMRLAGQVRKIPQTAKTVALWTLAEGAVVSEVREGIVLEWHRRTTAGGTARLELVTHREGQPLPRWSKAITPDQPREPVVAAALAFWRAA